MQLLRVKSNMEEKLPEAPKRFKEEKFFDQ